MHEVQMHDTGICAANHAFREIVKFERISPCIPCSEKNCTAWHWEKTICNDPLLHLQFRIEFPPLFPLVWPKVYITEDAFAQIGWIPHLGDDRSLCLFDSYTPPVYFDSPQSVTFVAMQKAKAVIISGLRYCIEDYHSEFLSYWRLNFIKDDNVWKILCWGNVICKKNLLVDILYLEEPIGGCFHVIVDPSHQKLFDHYVKLTKNRIKFTLQAFFIGNIISFDMPPFLLKNHDIYDVLIENKVFENQKFRNYFSTHSHPIILFEKKLINNNSLVLGWYHPKELKKHVNGFRNGIIQRLHQLAVCQSNDYVRRLVLEEFSLQRLYQRTVGMEYENSPSFLLIGVGSIGSNLVHFLNGYNPFWTFVDNDILKFENLGRHYLGPKYVGEFKAEGMKSFLALKNPLIDVRCYNNNILDILDNKLPEINNNDFIFSCLGEFNVEAYLGDYLSNGTITVPIFFLWVEPYLAGGHCLYIPPRTRKFSELFFDRLYRNDVIKPENYQNENISLILKESGCQSMYTPYAQIDVTLFLSALFPWIDKIIKSRDVNAQAFTWVGNLELLKEKGVTISPQFTDKKQGDVQKITL